MPVVNQPVPQWAMPFLGNEEEMEKLQLRFNPVWLRWFLDTIDNLSVGGLVQHNTLGGLQGGAPTEFYHLTQAGFNSISGTKAANLFYAGPATGAAAAPTFRAMVSADLPAGIVTYAKVQNVSATDRVLGRSSAGAGVVEEIPCTANGRAILALASGVSGTIPVDGAVAGTLSSVTLTNGIITGTTVR